MSDPEQTFHLPRQRAATDELVAGDDETVVMPKATLDEAHEQARAAQWDEPPARGEAAIEGSPYAAERALGTLAWVITMVATGALSLVRLNYPSMRVQELAAWSFTLAPKADLYNLLRQADPAEVPYYLLLKGWASLAGRSDFALRAPSVIAMACAAALIAKVGTRLVNPRVGLLAGLLVATLPVTSRYAAEAGPEAFTLFGAALATLALVNYLDRPRAWPFAGYAAAVALTGLSHLTGLLLVLAHGAVVLAMKRRLIGAWLGALVIGALPAAALIALFGAPLPATGASRPAFPAVSVLSQHTFGSVLAGGVLLGLAILALSVHKPGIVFTAWALVPLLLLYPVIRLTTIGTDDVAIVSLLGWVGLAGMFLGRALIVRGLAIVLVIAAIGVPDQLSIRRPDGHGQASHELANVLYRQGQPGDAIVYGPADGDGPAGRNIVERYLTAGHRPRDILAQTKPRENGRMHPRECPDVDACLGRTARVWLVRVGTLDSPLTGLEAGKDGALRVRYTAAQTWNLTGLTLTLFTLKPGA
ncbi:glycosyltransferase family 39 protein [Dactylosporangium sp. CA-139066]|uniref:glycosyltransferase family 39 protein n=1 Tax=Dactylosporangium sp. CA-139066 TaxID=3239930 RepID=UPI003D9018E7